MSLPHSNEYADLHNFVQLASFAICRDEGIVGGGIGGVAFIQHPPMHSHSLPRLVAHVARNDECVVCTQHRLHTL